MWHAFPGLQGVAIAGIYPCGKARKPDKSEGRECPLSLSPNDPGSVLAVKDARRLASRTGRLRADPKGGRFERERGTERQRLMARRPALRKPSAPPGPRRCGSAGRWRIWGRTASLLPADTSMRTSVTGCRSEPLRRSAR